MRKWRGILALLVSRRTFKSYADRRLGLGGTSKEGNRLFLVRRSVKRTKQKTRTSPFLLRRSKRLAHLSLSLSLSPPFFSHDSLGKRNVLVAPRTSTNANRATKLLLSGTDRKKKHVLRLFIKEPSSARASSQTYYLLRFLCFDSRNNTCGKQISKRRKEEYPRFFNDQERKRKRKYLSGKVKKMSKYVRNERE